MKVYDAASLRNVALVGHSGSGKTQLVSALLFDAGAVTRLGKVDEGTTVTDYDEEEIARKHTLSASVAYAEWNKTKINFIDTPGMANFLSDARAALRVADAALVVVGARDGREAESWKQALQTMDDLLESIRPKATVEERRGVARIIPALLKRLRTGVTESGIEDAVSQAFFQELMKCHTEVMQGAKAPAAEPAKAAADTLTKKPVATDSTLKKPVATRAATKPIRTSL